MNKLYAFESWDNGGKTQLSAFYEGDEASQFINDSGLSGTFATLHIFDDKVAAEKKYAELRGDNDTHYPSDDDGVLYPDDSVRTGEDNAMDNCEDYLID